MDLLSIFRSKGSSPRQKINKENVRIRYKTRIDNLSNELEILSRDLGSLELNLEITRPEKDSQSHRLIRRMTLIADEIGIRKGLLKCL